MKLKSSLKKWVNLREVQNDGVFLQYKLSDRDMVSKTLPGYVFSSIITHIEIFRKCMNFFVGIFFKFHSFLLIFSLIKCTKNDLKQ